MSVACLISSLKLLCYVNKKERFHKTCSMYYVIMARLFSDISTVFQIKEKRPRNNEETSW